MPRAWPSSVSPVTIAPPITAYRMAPIGLSGIGAWEPCSSGTDAEASGVGLNALVASGLVLFVLTFVVNAAARYVVNRRGFSGAN